MISVNINRNNFTVYFKGDNVVKMSSWFCDWIESTFYVYLTFILHQFVTRVASARRLQTLQVFVLRAHSLPAFCKHSWSFFSVLTLYSLLTAFEVFSRLTLYSPLTTLEVFSRLISLRPATILFSPVIQTSSNDICSMTRCNALFRER